LKHLVEATEHDKLKTMTSKPKDKSYLRNSVVRMQRYNQESLHLNSYGASIISHTPSNVLGRGAISACFHITSNQALAFLRIAKRALKYPEYKKRVSIKSDWDENTIFVLKVLCPKPDLIRKKEERKDVFRRFQREGLRGVKIPRHSI